MELSRRIAAFSALGVELKKKIADNDEAFIELCDRCWQQNNWFTKPGVEAALTEWSNLLAEENLRVWLKPYSVGHGQPERRIGVINAGNIPLVGMHDFVSVLVSGFSYLGKNASDDRLLLPYVASLLTDAEPGFKNRIRFEEKLSGFHSVIATGSNNSSRYFESYFAGTPHLIRKNRNGVAVLSGKESGEELAALGKDIFQYYGLGCRNVSKLYVPESYDFNVFFEAMYPHNAVMQHHKYMNNFDYNQAMLLLKQLPFLQNGFLIIREDERIASPIAVVHYERYTDMQGLSEKLDAAENEVQCIAANNSLPLKSGLNERTVPFGSTQSPALWDYADGADTLKFLLSA